MTLPKNVRCAADECGHASHRHDAAGRCTVLIEDILHVLQPALCSCPGLALPDTDSNVPLARHASVTERPRMYAAEWARLACASGLPRNATPETITEWAEAMLFEHLDRCAARDAEELDDSLGPDGVIDHGPHAQA